MTVDTTAAPYYDDFDETKNFSKILYRPDRAVQARELNQQQTITQKQISRFGDNIFKQGSVVSGCHVTSIKQLPYVKVLDVDITGARVDVTKYSNLYVKNGANTVGYIVASSSGFENRAPDLNTIFVRYINSGDNGSSATFDAGNALTVYDPNYPLVDVAIVNGSSGYTDNDRIALIPAVAVQNTTGGNTFSTPLAVGQRISNGVGANVSISAISYFGSKTTVSLTALSNDLDTANTSAWNVATGNYVNANTAETVVVSAVLGTGAAAAVVTNGNGTITGTVITATGQGYSVAPTAVVVSTTATLTQKQQTLLTAENYTDKITVAGSGTSPIGFGFGVTVDSGVIYQNNQFIRTDQQFVVASKYSPTPTGIVIGFVSDSTVVSHIEDESLYDNALGSPNYSAPGADRLKTTASIVSFTDAEAASRTDFVSLVEFSEGEPVKTNDSSTFNVIGDAIAERTFEQAGNFVVDPFLVNTKSAVIASEPTSFSLVVDPGTAYIEGYRVATDRNTVLTVAKAATTTSVAMSSNVDYGNYVAASSIYGIPTIDSIVNLQNLAYDVTPGAAIAAAGTVIGQARIRGVKRIDNTYRIYLYDLVINSGQAFTAVRSVADTGNTFAANITTPVDLMRPDIDRSIFPLPSRAVKQVSNLSYTFQKGDWGTVTANTTGFATLTVSAPLRFPVTGVLTTEQLKQVIVTPSANIVSTATLAGTLTTVASNTTVTGSGTSLQALAAGSFISIGNSTSNSISKVVSVVNATSMIVSPAPSVSYTAVNGRVAFPRNEVITLPSANVSTNGLTLTLNLGVAIPSSNVSVITNVTTTPTVASKTVTRNAVARINNSTSPAGVVGPWPLGVSDIIRLRNVYIGANTTFTSASAGIVDATNDFYIDSNNTPEASGTGYLYQKPNARNAVTTSSRLLVVFDVLVSSSTQPRTVSSYPLNDAVTLASSAATINTVELPEVNGSAQYYDTRDSVDFRPSAANTIAIQTAQSTAPINPTEPVYASKFATATLFPAPDTVVTGTVEYYLPRNDLVVATSNGSIVALTGEPGQQSFVAQPSKTLVINRLVIPPYPSLPSALSGDMATLVDTKVANDRYANRRNATYTISTTFTPAQISQQQPRRYRMADIGALDRRVQAVEYSLGLTLAETQTNSRNITSANSPTTDRFKFGFFVDSFNDASRTDAVNPQYTATIVDNVARPRALVYTVSLQPQDAETADGLITLPFVSQPFISQLGSTDGAVVPPAPVVVPPLPTPLPADPEVIPSPTTPITITATEIDTTPVSVTTQSIQRATQRELSNRRAKVGQIFEGFHYVFSETAGPVKLMMNWSWNTNAIEVFQSTTPIPNGGGTLIKNSLNVVPWSSTEIASPEFTNLTVANYQPQPYGLFRTFGTAPNVKPTWEHTGKLEWNHDPANGRYYYLKVTKYRHNRDGKTEGRYTYALLYPADFTTTVGSPGMPMALDFYGIISGELTPYTEIAQSATNSVYYIAPQAYKVVVTGLKPVTVYSCIFDNVNVNTKCAPIGGAIGAPLITGVDGVLEFILYYDGQTNVPYSELQQTNNVANLLATTKVLTVTNGSDSSATTTVTPRPYTLPSAIYTIAPIVVPGLTGFGTGSGGSQGFGNYYYTANDYNLY